MKVGDIVKPSANWIKNNLPRYCDPVLFMINAERYLEDEARDRAEVKNYYENICRGIIVDGESVFSVKWLTPRPKEASLKCAWWEEKDLELVD